MALKLIQRGIHEAENPIEVSLREAFELRKPQLNPPFSLKVLTQEEYSKINKALIFGILSQSHLAKVHIKHLHAIITDGYGFFTCILVNIVDELYPKLLDSVKIQLIWVTKEMLNVLAIGFDKLLVVILRQIVGGDFREGNLWLCLEMVTLFLANWDCLLEEEPLVLNKGLYVFLRLLADHYRVPSTPMVDALKRMEVEFCVRLLREHFPLCLKIGRDLIRLLQDLVHIPEFKSIWKDLLLNPRQFRADGFEDISQIYRIRTSSLYFLLRVTPEMETKLRFLLTHVRLGSQKRYQVWFAKKFLGVPERETILTDIVRFICCSVRPSSEITQPDILPRWAVIGWLLKSCRKSYIEANVKLALFYDWLFFDETTDNVMNIEPAILLMVNSIPKYIEVTHTLLEFLLIVVDNYDIERKEIISNGVSTALSTIVKKGIIGSLDILTRCDMISPVLREMLGKMLLVMQSSHSKKLGSASVTHDISPPIHLLPSSLGSQHPNSVIRFHQGDENFKEKFEIKVIGETSLLPPDELHVTSCSIGDKVPLKWMKVSRKSLKSRMNISLILEATLDELEQPVSSTCLLGSHVLHSADSLSIPSEPPHIGNRFSSYTYESPVLSGIDDNVASQGDIQSPNKVLELPDAKDCFSSFVPETPALANSDDFRVPESIDIGFKEDTNTKGCKEDSDNKEEDNSAENRTNGKSDSVSSGVDVASKGLLQCIISVADNKRVGQVLLTCNYFPFNWEPPVTTCQRQFCCSSPK